MCAVVRFGRQPGAPWHTLRFLLLNPLNRMEGTFNFVPISQLGPPAGYPGSAIAPCPEAAAPIATLGELPPRVEMEDDVGAAEAAAAAAALPTWVAFMNSAGTVCTGVVTKWTANKAVVLVLEIFNTMTREWQWRRHTLPHSSLYSVLPSDFPLTLLPPPELLCARAGGVNFPLENFTCAVRCEVA